MYQVHAFYWPEMLFEDDGYFVAHTPFEQISVVAGAEVEVADFLSHVTVCAVVYQ